MPSSIKDEQEIQDLPSSPSVNNTISDESSQPKGATSKKSSLIESFAGLSLLSSPFSLFGSSRAKAAIMSEETLVASPRRKLSKANNDSLVSKSDLKHILTSYGLSWLLVDVVLKAMNIYTDKAQEVAVERPALLGFLSELKRSYPDYDDMLFELLSLAYDVETYPALQTPVFEAFVTDIVENHRVFRFLLDEDSNSDNALQHFIQTIVVRLMYENFGHVGVLNPKFQISRSAFRKMSLHDNLLSLQLCDSCFDSEMPPSFSYQEFYVCFGQFWRLDVREQQVLTLKELVDFDPSVPKQLLKRIIEWHTSVRVGPRHDSSLAAFLTYSEFLVFLLAVIEKTTDMAMSYWFEILDMDGDGKLSRFELEWAWSEPQTGARTTISNQDFFVMVFDMIQPKHQHYITLLDIRKRPCSFAQVLELILDAHSIHSPKPAFRKTILSDPAVKFEDDVIHDDDETVVLGKSYFSLKSFKPAFRSETSMPSTSTTAPEPNPKYPIKSTKRTYQSKRKAYKKPTGPFRKDEWSMFVDREYFYWTQLPSALTRNASRL